MFEFLFAKKQLYYRRTFFCAEGRKVLEDLGSFCHVDSSTFDPNPTIHARNEGRREVMLYILQTLNIDVEEIGGIQNGNSDSVGFLD